MTRTEFYAYSVRSTRVCVSEYVNTRDIGIRANYYNLQLTSNNMLAPSVESDIPQKDASVSNILGALV